MPIVSPRPRAVIVDDDPSVLAFLSEVLDGAGWDTATVTRGDLVVERCRQFKPILVLMDVLMPGQDGFTVLAQLRSESDLEDIRVVLVSGEPMEIHGEIARRLGAHDFLEKPASIASIHQLLEDVLEEVAR